MRTRDARTILEILPQIDKYCECIAKANTARAIQSYSLDWGETYRIMETIIDKTYKSQVLHNLKIKVMKQLEGAPPKTKKVIELFFIERKKKTAVAKTLDISERTLFRAAENAVEWFAKNLDACGVTEDAYRRLLADYNWIRSVHQQFA